MQPTMLMMMMMLVMMVMMVMVVVVVRVMMITVVMMTVTVMYVVAAKKRGQRPAAAAGVSPKCNWLNRDFVDAMRMTSFGVGDEDDAPAPSQQVEAEEDGHDWCLGGV